MAPSMGENALSPEALIGRFAKQRILVVGDVMLDWFIWGSVSRISPEAPVPVVEVPTAVLARAMLDRTGSSLEAHLNYVLLATSRRSSQSAR